MARVVFGVPIPPEVTLVTEPFRFVGAGARGDRLTASGWRYTLAAEDVDGSFVAVYAFLDHEAIVRARGPRELVTAVLASARPDWTTDDIIALHQLWES